MAPVTRFNGVPVGCGTPGPVFEQLLAAYSAEVCLDIRAQVLSQAATERGAA